jgi:hypothetical protein
MKLDLIHVALAGLAAWAYFRSRSAGPLDTVLKIGTAAAQSPVLAGLFHAALTGWLQPPVPQLAAPTPAPPPTPPAK